MSETLGERIRKLRKKARLTQEQLAEAVDVHLNTVSRWENGELIPKTLKLKAIAAALGVTEADLLNDSPPENGGWVLTVKVAPALTEEEEVIDMRKSVPVKCSITSTPEGAFLTLGGSWELWTTENKDELIKQLNKFFETVQQNGIALGGLPKP